MILAFQTIIALTLASVALQAGTEITTASVQTSVAVPALATDHGDGDHGGGGLPQPQTPAEIGAYVAAVMSEPEGHAHGDDPSKLAEHGQAMELVDRSEATHVAISDGDWFDAGTWYQGRIPDADAKVLIPQGVSVTYDGESDSSLFTVRVDGELSFATDTDTSMLVDTLIVSATGRLEMGTAETPVEAGVTAKIIIANNGDIDVSWDPTLLSRGVISHGEMEVHGAEKTAFLKVSDAPMRGDTSISLAEVPESWAVGDTVVVSGTHREGWQWVNGQRENVGGQDEEVTITAITGDGITIDRPLIYDHDTPRDDLFAYVANTTRNVTFSSEDGADTAIHHRGHVMLMHSDDVDVRYAAFDDLGRTDKSVDAFDVTALGSVEADSNIKARYSLHFHKAGTTDQDDPAMVVGTSVSGNPGWAYVNHSSNVNFIDNIAFDVFGAGFSAEDGDETGMFLRNMAIHIEGANVGAKDKDDVARHDNGRTGDGFFFMGRLVEVAENVAINTTNGYVWMHRGSAADPLSASLDHPEIGYGADTIQVNHAPIQGFRDNEAFGTQTGMIVIKANPSQEIDIRTVMDGFLNWETEHGAKLAYTSHYTLRNFDLIATDSGGGLSGRETAVELGNNTFDITFNGLSVQGFDIGADLDNSFTFNAEDSDHDNILIDVAMLDVDTAYLGFDHNRHTILTSDDLTPGRLDFVMQGETTLSNNQAFYFDGIKTDSIGSRDRQFTGDIQSLSGSDVRTLLAAEGYYQTEDGRKIMLIEDFVADRATGELYKFSHVVTLEFSDTQLSNIGAESRGLIDLGSTALVARDDAFSVQGGQDALIDVLANDYDPEGAFLRVDGMTDPENGDLFLQDDGQLLYRANDGYAGSDSFSYWAADDAGLFSKATVIIDVKGSS